MEAEKWKERLVSYLYGELTEAERQETEAWLKKNPQAMSELDELKQLRSEMQQWPDTAAVPPMLPVAETMQSKSKTISPWFWLVSGVAASWILLFMAGMLAGMEIQYNRSGFSMHIGKKEPPLQPVATPVASDKRIDSLYTILRQMAVPAKVSADAAVAGEPGLTKEQMAQVVEQARLQQNRQLQGLLAVVQQQQDKQLRNTLQTFAGFLEQRRKTDLQVISNELENIKQTSNTKFYETDYALDQLYKTVQYPNY